MELGLSTLVPIPFEGTCRPVLEKRISMPRPLPKIEMVEHEENQVCFRLPAHDTYLKSVPDAPVRSIMYYEATTPLGWETFFPMTFDMLSGLTRLFNSAALGPQRLTMLDEAGTLLTEPVLLEGFRLRFEDRVVPLYRNLAALNRLGRPNAGGAGTLSLVTEDGHPFECTIQYGAKQLPHFT